MAIDAGTAYIDVEARLDKLDADLDKKAPGIFGRFGTKGGDQAGGAFKGAFGGVLAGLGTDALVRGAFNFLGGAMEEGLAKSKLDARIETLVRNAGSIGSQVSRGAFDDIGRELGKQLVIDDDDVRDGIAPLLNIPNLTQPMFARLSQLSVDTAAATKKGLGEVSTAISRISQAPDQAARSFRSLGIIVDDETVKIVDDLVAQGKTAEATSVLVGELEKRYGGAGKAAGDAAGPQQKFSVAVADLQEKVGLALLPALESLTPILTELADIAGQVLPPVLTALGPLLEFLGDHATLVVGAFLPVVAVINAVKWAVEELGPTVRTVIAEVVDIFLAGVEWIVRGAASAFGWVPGVGAKLKGAARAIEGFRDDANAALRGIDEEKTIRINIVEAVTRENNVNTGTAGDPTFNNGAPEPTGEPAFAGGGVVPGPQGKALRALVHGGETVFTPDQMDVLASGLSGGSFQPIDYDALAKAMNDRPVRAYVTTSDLAHGLHVARQR